MQESEPAVLRLHDVCRRYGDLEAVDSVSLSVARGELLALLGPNGAGKTTLLKMVMGLLAPDCGRIEAGTGSGRARRQSLGYCPQRLVLWPDLTCQEQLHLLGHAYGLARASIATRADNLLAQVGLSDKRRVLARELSGGMQRRLNLALGLMHDPELVVLDEPEAGLDPQSRLLVRNLIAALVRQQAKAVILATHDMEEAARLADRVAIMDRGRLLACDTLDSLLGGDVSTETVEVHWSRATAAEREALTAQLSAEIGRVRDVGDRLQIETEDATAAIVEVRAALAGLPASSSFELRVRRHTLEDLFFELTGKELRA